MVLPDLIAFPTRRSSDLELFSVLLTLPPNVTLPAPLIAPAAVFAVPSPKYTCPYVDPSASPMNTAPSRGTDSGITRHELFTGDTSTVAPAATDTPSKSPV